MRRPSLALLALLALPLLLAAAGAGAQTYPAKPIRLIVPYPPGGGNDTLARIFGQKLTEAWGQQVIVDNRAGAGTTLGTAMVARANPDGYTLLLSSIASHAVAPYLYARPGYDPVKDFSPVTLLAVAPTVLVVHPSVPAKTLAELIAHAHANPGKLKMASGGNGAASHILGEVFKATAKVDLVHVPYKGGGPSIIGMIANEAQVLVDPGASILPHVKPGRLRALAIHRKQRLPEFPDIPTFAEAGLPAYDADAWYSVHAPARTPPEIVAKLNKELVRILGTAEIKERLKDLGSDGIGNTPEQFAKFIAAEAAKYSRLIRQIGVRIE